MILYPAIDLLGGQAVRLAQGDYERVTAYDADPVEAALRWLAQGAEALHVVDLDGAKSGEGENLEAIERIVAKAPVPVQVGGGIRDASSVERYLGLGIARAVVGSLAVTDPDLACELASRYGDALVVSVDSRSGLATTDGWTRSSGFQAVDLVERLSTGGVKRFIHTPVEADGLLQGPALESLAAISEAAGSSGLIYSGGIGGLDELRSLAQSAPDNVEGVIVGRALYEGAFDVTEAIDALAAKPTPE